MTVILPALGTLVILAVAAGLAELVARREHARRIETAHRSGVWHGADEPAPGFRGYWDNGRAVQVWPLTVGTHSMTTQQLHESEED